MTAGREISADVCAAVVSEEASTTEHSCGTHTRRLIGANERIRPNKNDNRIERQRKTNAGEKKMMKTHRVY